MTALPHKLSPPVRNIVIFTVPLAIEGPAEALEWTWVEFTVDETVDVVVCMMYSPGEFYCHFLKDDGKLARELLVLERVLVTV